MFTNFFQTVPVEADFQGMFNALNQVTTDTVNDMFKNFEKECRYPIDLSRDKDGTFTIEVAAAGKTKEDIKLKSYQKDGDTYLSISTIEKTEEQPAAKTYIVRKIKSADKLALDVVIPNDVDIKKLTAKMENGLLTIQIPATEETKPIEFEIA